MTDNKYHDYPQEEPALQEIEFEENTNTLSEEELVHLWNILNDIKLNKKKKEYLH